MAKSAVWNAAIGRWLALAAFGLGLSWTAFEAWTNPESDLRHPAVLNTAHFSFALWSAAALLMLIARSEDWSTRSALTRTAQWTWFLAMVMFVVHIIAAFHFAHNWRHANAFQHVEQTSGFGPGIFVSYSFTLLWIADAIWFSVAPVEYARRPRWFAWLIHSFMAFITFNATVVYGHGMIRWIAAVVFAALGVAWLWPRRSIFGHHCVSK